MPAHRGSGARGETARRHDVARSPAVTAVLEADIDALLERRVRLTRPFFVAEAERIARLCHRMAERFACGGRLIAAGRSPAARSDVRHIAVEFVHPVIVGKRALPAIGLTADAGPLASQVALVADPGDIVIAFVAEEHATSSGGADEEARDAIAVARRRGCLTIALADLGAEWQCVPPSDDAFVQQELAETLYHVLWELVHVFFEHPGLLDGGAPSAADVHDAGASSFLYPFLARDERDLENVIADVRQSVIMKAEEITALRVRTVAENRVTLVSAAAALRHAFERDGSILVFGNGGSATDAMDAAADYRFPPASRGWPSRRALDLTEDAAILTALANDIGPDALFSRQIIAFGRPRDVAMAFSTSGNSRNVVQALAEARRRGLVTIAFVGYGGGQILTEQLADHVLVIPSQYVPRIQEAQATAHHILRELVERL